ncbi:MAG: iron ABC transporter permease [Acidobacteria bacterium]|nr:iron ABC transporter permease [Acidobacteriota bacterium]
MGRILTARQAFLGGAALLVAAAGLLPVAVMTVRSLLAESSTGYAYYRTLFGSGRIAILAGHSIALAASTTALALAMGVPLGILLGRTDLPLRRLLLVLFSVPLLLPPYVMAFSWFDVLGRHGAVTAWLDPQVGVATSGMLFGLGGCVLVLTTAFLPIVVLLTLTYLNAVDPRLEEAGRLVSSWPGVLRCITLPLIAPGIALAGVLVFLLSLGEMSVPMFLRYDVFPLEVFAQFSAFYDFEAATSAALPLALVTFLLLFAEDRLLQQRSRMLRTGSTGAAVARIHLGRRRWSLSALVWTGALVLVPVGCIIAQSLAPGALVEAISRAGASLGRGVVFAAIGAFALMIIGFLCGYLIRTRALALWRWVDFMTVFLFATPSPVMAVGLIGLWNHRSTSFIYSTPLIVLIGYVAQYTALTSRITAVALDHIPSSMEEAARIAGARWTTRMIRIVMPMSKKGLLAAWLVAYIFCLRDTGLTMLLYPSGQDTLPVRTMTLMANGLPSVTAALCVLMIGVTLVPAGLLAVLMRRAA